jgi:hypothetical protein
MQVGTMDLQPQCSKTPVLKQCRRDPHQLFSEGIWFVSYTAMMRTFW